MVLVSLEVTQGDLSSVKALLFTCYSLTKVPTTSVCPAKAPQGTGQLGVSLAALSRGRPAKLAATQPEVRIGEQELSG